MFTGLVIFHVLVCIALVLVVLLQSSKGEGLAGSAFGGSGGLSGAVFGGRGAASFLSRATTVLAVIFMLNCGGLAVISSSGRTGGTAPEQTESAVTRQAQREQEEAMRRQQEQQQQQLNMPDSAAGGDLFQLDATPVEPGDNTGN